MTFAEFLTYQFPERSVFARKNRDPFQNLVKWLAMYVAYALYKMNVPANLVTLVIYFLSLSGFLMLATAREGYRLGPILGALLINFHVFGDFLDGAIAKAAGTTSKIGAVLDDLGLDTDRIGLIVLFGFFTGEPRMLILNLFVAGFLVFFVPHAFKEMPQNGLLGKFIHLYVHRYSFLSVRFMLGWLPPFLILVIWQQWDLPLISWFLSVSYAVAALVWLFLILPTRSSATA